MYLFLNSNNIYSYIIIIYSIYDIEYKEAIIMKFISRPMFWWERWWNTAKRIYNYFAKNA